MSCKNALFLHSFLTRWGPDPLCSSSYLQCPLSCIHMTDQIAIWARGLRTPSPYVTRSCRPASVCAEQFVERRRPKSQLGSLRNTEILPCSDFSPLVWIHLYRTGLKVAKLCYSCRFLFCLIFVRVICFSLLLFLVFYSICFHHTSCIPRTGEQITRYLLLCCTQSNWLESCSNIHCSGTKYIARCRTKNTI